MSNKLLASLVAALSLGALADPYVLYVSPNGNDAASGETSSAPLRTINMAVATMEHYADIDEVGGKVYLLNGNYLDETTQYPLVDNLSNTAVVVTHPISIEGYSKDASQVMVKRSSGTFRLFYLNHANAAVRHLTIAAGNSGKNPGGGVYIGANGGSVEDCVITGCAAGNVSGKEGGGGVYMESGRVMRTTVTGCSVGNMRRYGAGIYATGGVVDNCLVTGCKTSHHGTSCNGNAAVCLLGSAKMVNSTVVKNTSCLVTGVWIGSKNAQAVNCAVYGNYLCTSTHSDGATRYNGCFVNLNVGNTTLSPVHATEQGDLFVACASESEPYTDSCIQLSESPFTDFDGSDYTHGLYSPLANKGNSALARSLSSSETDLYGNDRYSGTFVDIGVYELQQGFSLNATVDKSVLVLPDDAVATFTAEQAGASGDVTYTWNFGDGTAALSTAESTVSHTYTAGGVYEVSVSASDGVHSSYYILPKKVAVYTMSFTCIADSDRVVEGGTMAFSVSDVSTDESVTYTWNFGDGGTVVSSDVQAQHTYTEDGVYSVSCHGISSTGREYEYIFAEPVTVVPRDLYADPSNTGGKAPYATWATAGNKLSTIIAYAADGCVIHLKAGTYANDKSADVKVNKGVTIIGEGDTPADVVIPGNANDSGSRNMTVSAEGALVCNLTLYGGFAGQSTGGGANLYLSAGTVSNCVLSSGRAHNNGSEAGGAKVVGGLLTHCVITNSWNRNRGDGLVLTQTGGRVSNTLITRNWKSFDVSRNPISLVYVSGGVIDNCTIAKCWIMYNTNEGKYTTTDKAVQVTGTGKAYNLAIADISYVGYSAATDSVVDYPSATPQRWAGTAENFVKCVTDDAAPINATCTVGTTATMFQDYANGDLTPGPALKNKGGAVEGYAVPSVDLAGLPRLNRAIDVGCYEKQPVRGMNVIFR